MENNAIAVGVAMGLTQVAKTLGMPTKFAPLCSAIIGTLVGMALLGFTITGGLTGLVSGLAASGLYDVGTKTGSN